MSEMWTTEEGSKQQQSNTVKGLLVYTMQSIAAEKYSNEREEDKCIMIVVMSIVEKVE